MTNTIWIEALTPQQKEEIKSEFSKDQKDRLVGFKNYDRRASILTTPRTLRQTKARLAPNEMDANIIKSIGASALKNKEKYGVDVIVGIIDSGVDVKHPLLGGSYLGTKNGGWYDPLGKTSHPVDYKGHGTELAIIIAGDRMGVAPDAKWMACAMDSAKGWYILALLKCTQHMLCPKSSNGKCKNTPHVINNSYGRPKHDNEVQLQMESDVVNVWRKADIIPVFSAGNRGKGVLGSMARNEKVIAVGNTYLNGTVMANSSRGDALTFVSVGSSGGTAGTSFATARVSGIIALLLSAFKGLI